MDNQAFQYQKRFKGTMMRSDLRWVMTVFLIALVLRTGLAFYNWDHPAIFMKYDSYGYHQIAVNLLGGNGYSWNEEAPYEPNIYRPPGIPILLMSVYWLFSPYVPCAILIQALVASSTVLLTYEMAATAFGTKCARWASLMVAVDPISIVYSNLLLTETHTAFLVSLCGVLVIRYIRLEDVRYLLGIGLCLAVGILVHPILILLPLFLVLLPLTHRPTRSRKHFEFAAVAAIIALVPAICWMARNYRVADYFGISSVTAVNLLKYKAAGVMAEIRGTSRSIEGPRLAQEIKNSLPSGSTYGDNLREWKRRSFGILLQHPAIYARLHFKGMTVEACGPGKDNLQLLLYGREIDGRRTMSLEKRVTDAQIHSVVREKGDIARTAVVNLAVVLHLFVLLLAAGGAVWLFKTKNYTAILALSFIPLYVLAVSGGPEGDSRFRVIWVPYLAMFFAFGMDGCRDLSIFVLRSMFRNLQVTGKGG